MAINFKKIWTGLTVVPKTASTADSQGEIEVLSADSKLRYHNGTSSSPVLTEAHSATITNKVIDADDNTISDLEVDNLKAGVLNTDTSLTGASDTQIPSALAVKTYVDNSSGAVQNDVDDLITLSGVPANSTDLGTFTGTTIPDGSDNKEALQALETGLEAHIADAVDAHDASAISVVPTGNLAADDVQEALVELQGDIDTVNTTLTTKVTGPASATDEAIARFDGTTGKLVQNSVVTITDAGIAAGLTGLTSSGTVSSTGTLAIGGNLTESLTTDAATTGANATLTNPATSFVRLTNASLSSIDMISAPVAGEVITIQNATGVDITINNDLGGTAANRILTGTKANLTLKDEASIIVKYDSSESRWMVIGGTGAGSGSGINYILSSDGGSTTGWATYADAAAAIPVDGTGGAPNVTFATTTSSPLVGTSSFLFTKDAANRQGQGVSYAFTIDSGYQAQVLRISFPYSASANYLDTVSGNLINSDMQVFVYDVTNSQLIYVTEQNIGASSQGQYVGSFQTSSNSTSYRLILHVASTNATAYTLKLDNVVVGPQILIKGPVDTYLGQLTTTGSWITNTTYTFNYWRRGDKLIADGVISTSGAPTATNLNINIPAGLSIDSSKINISTDAIYQGSGNTNDSGSAYRIVGVRGSGTTTNLRIMYLVQASANWDNVSNTAPFTFGAGDSVYVRYEVPIQGWSSNLQLSEDTGNRQVIFRGYRNAALNITTGGVKIAIDATTSDTVAGFDSTNGRYVAQESGYYDLTGKVGLSSLADTGSIQAYIYVNGSVVADGVQFRMGGAGGAHSLAQDVRFLNKGDYVELYCFQNDTASEAVLTGHNATYLIVAKRATPQTLAGSETVAAYYNTNAGQAVNNAAVIIFEDRVFDTHNAMNTSTGEYTVPATGKYKVSWKGHTQGVAATVGNVFITRFYVNSVIVANGAYDYCQNTASRNYVSPGEGLFSLNKGDVLKVDMTEDIPAVNLNTTAFLNYFTIVRVGN
jgi:hypothetical protein